MAFKSVLKLESKIFNKEARAAIAGRVAVRAARKHKDSLRKKMVFGTPTGREYDREIGAAGYGVRIHRASRPGERPAVFTGNLANRAIKHRRISETAAETFVDEETAPYVTKLVRIKRVIISGEDRREAQADLTVEAQKAITELIS